MNTVYLNILNLQDLLINNTLDRVYKHYTLLRYCRFYLHVFDNPRLCPTFNAGSKTLHFRSSIRQNFLLKLLGSDANTGSCISILILMCIARSNYTLNIIPCLRYR